MFELENMTFGNVMMSNSCEPDDYTSVNCDPDYSGDYSCGPDYDACNPD